MTDKKTYRIDENALRTKLVSYTVNINANSFSFLENEVAHVKTSPPIELPDTKKLVQYIGIPVAIGVLGCLIYFGVSYIKNLPTTPKQDTTVVAKPAESKQEENKITPQPVVTQSIATTEEKKKDTIISTTTTVATPPQPIKVKEKKMVAMPAVTTTKKDSDQTSTVAKTKLDTAEKKTKVDTASVNKNKDISTKKKKKKRKNSLDATDDIRQSQPNTDEDNVVIPDGLPK